MNDGKVIRFPVVAARGFRRAAACESRSEPCAELLPFVGNDSVRFAVGLYDAAFRRKTPAEWEGLKARHQADDAVARTAFAIVEWRYGYQAAS